MVAQIDESKSNEFRDVQDLDVAETGKRSANAGKQCSNGNEDVAEEADSAFIHCEILDGRIHRTAKQKNEGVEVEEGRKTPDPLPREDLASEPLIEAFRNFNR